jgi:hypothetical protein
MVRDEDNDAGFYAAGCATNPNGLWSGASVFVSRDAGATWSSMFALTAEATIGRTTNTLANFLGGNIPDENSRVDVRLLNGALASTNYAGLLAGTNACVIGDEILFFRDAAVQFDGSYTLSGFLRGRRGSEYAMSTHATGERFVLLKATTVTRVQQATADIGIERLYRAVTLGTLLADAPSQAFTNQGTGLKPYAPVQVGGGRDAAGNLTLNWVRRNRMSGEWRDSVDVPNSEAYEAYEVDVFTNGSYAAVVRTVSASSPTATYTAAQQVADFGFTPATVYFRVYQLSAIVGRGHAASGRG